jgi:hypothetical protein
MQRYVVFLICTWLFLLSWCTVPKNVNSIDTNQITQKQLIDRTTKAIAWENIKNSVKIVDYALLWTKLIDDNHQELYLVWNFEEFGLDTYGDIIVWWWASQIPFVLGITKQNGIRTYAYNKQAPDGSLFLKWLNELFPKEIVQEINGWTYTMQINRPLWKRAEELLDKKIYTPYSWSRPRLLGKRCEININKYLDQWLQEFKKTDNNCVWANGIDYTMIFGSGWHYQDFLIDPNSKAIRRFSWWTGVVVVQEQDNSWNIVHQRRIRIIESTNDTMKIKMDII